MALDGVVLEVVTGRGGGGGVRYVDTTLQLIHLAGDFVADDVWHRIIQMVTNHKDLQVSS